MPMIVSNLQSLRPLVAVVSLKRATIRPHPGALGPISTRPTGPAVVCRMRMPKWAAQRRSHAATRQTDARLTTDAKWILDLGPGYVVSPHINTQKCLIIAQYSHILVQKRSKIAQGGPKIPICVPLFGKSPKISTSYLGKLNGSQQKLIGFGQGAPPRAQIR